MKPNAKGPPLRLEVTDFGPVVHAEVDLRPLTVFVGPGNTGKSYLAILIYALHRFFSGGSLARRSWDRLLEGRETKKLAETVGDAAVEWVGQLVGDDVEPRGDQARLSLPPLVADSVQRRLGLEGESMSVELRRCFGSAIADLSRKPGSGRAHFRTRQAERGRLGSGHSFDFMPEADKLTAQLADGVQVDLRRREMLDLEILSRHVGRRSGHRGTELLRARLVSELTNLVLPELVGPLDSPAYYLPADRTGVMHAHSVVVSALIDNASMAGLRPPARTPTLSGVLADFLEQIIQIDTRPGRGRRPRHDHADRIESAILRGAVQIDRGETSGYPSFRYQPDGWKDSLPLMCASSMVSELAPVVLYLRHLVRPGDLLIVEEPESHLHPSMQVEFTRQLAALVMEGIRVLLTTHSEWVLEELSNIVLASHVQKSGRKALPGGDAALGADDVGVWAFHQKARPRGTVIEEVRLDASGDLYSAGFDEVACETYDKWVDLGNLAGRGS